MSLSNPDVIPQGRKHAQPIKVALVAYEGISAFHLSVPCMVFQDMFVDMPVPFELNIGALSDGDIRSSSGFSIRLSAGSRPLRELIAEADLVIVPGWPNELPTPPEWLLTALSQAHARGAQLAGFCLGAFVIAATGLLDGHRATTHWAFAGQFKDRFPEVELDAKPLFIEEHRVMTSAGIAASLDCCLHLVRLYLGGDMATQLARLLVTAPFRAGGQQQYIPAPKVEVANSRVSFGQLLDEVSQHLHLAHSIDTVAARCAMSRRTFTRQFKASYGCTFGDWLLNQRLRFSQQLLETSEAGIAQIAERAGFGSESVYRKHFKRAFKVSPSQWRESFAVRLPG